jgi:uncharacterized protein (DUF1501 family)
MKRRDFLGKSITGGLIPLVLNGLPVRAIADNPLIKFLSKAGNEDRILVMIQLNGGNDGLNTVIPLDQYSNMSAVRSNILIPENKVLALTGTQATGLHPAMAELRGMYDNGKISIVQSVGYPNPDYSHFRSTDIWLTGSDSNQFLNTGWMGRYLDTQFPGFPNNYPDTEHPDPPAIQIGYMVSPALQGDHASMGMSITDPTSFYQFVNGTVDPAPNTPYGHEITFLRLVAQQTQEYSATIKTAAGKATNKSPLYPAANQNELADQLKIVAQLIAGGLKTQVYVVSLGGFDTHASQVSSTSGTETGVHAQLLKKISVAVNAFQDDLRLLNIADRVLGMTFSEFGRRITSNASYGTDHGAAAPLFLFGSGVNGGIYGSNPIVPPTATVDDNIPMQYDFRSVYASILKNWFEVNDTDLNTIMLKTFPEIPFVNPNTAVAEVAGQAQIGTLDNYPNPAQTYTNIRFSCSGGYIRIRLFDSTGKEIMTLAEGTYVRGSHEVTIDVNGLQNGMYYYQVQSGSNHQMKMMYVTR